MIGEVNMKWKKIICMISIISMMFSGTQAVRASYDYISKDTTNVVTISNVGIKLVYEKERADIVTVGQKIEQAVAIENVGKTPVYVRLKFDKYWTEKDTVDADGNKVEGTKTAASEICKVENIFLDIQDDINWTNENWTYNSEDNCYYYKSLLPVGGKTEPLPYFYQITDGVLEQVKDKDGNVTGTKYKSEYENMQGNIKAYGEAVQDISEQFINQYIEFDSGTPKKVIGWKDVTIDPKSIEKPSTTPISNPPDETNVKFDEDASKFVTIHGDNLFLNMSNMLPGDTQTQKIDINNSSEETVDIYLYAEPAENDYIDAEAKKAMDDLLSMITLKVGKYVSEDNMNLPNEIYNDDLGKMSDEKGEDNKILLGTFKKGDNVILQASITLDPKWDIGNAETKIKWIFMCSKRTQNINSPNPIIPPTTELPIKTQQPEVPTKAPDITKQPSVTVVPTIIPTEAVKTMGPLPEQTETVFVTKEPKPTDGEKPIKTPIPTPLHTQITDVTITPLVPKPSKGTIGEAGLDTAQPIDKVPTRSPIETQDDVKDPGGNVDSTEKSQASSSPEATDIPYTNPKTGDRNRLIFWVIIFMISLTVFAITIRGSKKQY